MDFFDALKGEIEQKKKLMANVAGDKTFVKGADLEAKRQKEYEEEQKRLEERRLAKKRRQEEERLEHSHRSDSESESSKNVKDLEVLKIPNKEVIRNLRRRGEPIRLFGETDEERVYRLRALEAAQPEVDGQLNEFRQQISNLDHALDLEALKRKAEEEASTKEDPEEKKQRKILDSLSKEPINAEMFELDRDKLYILIHDYFKRLLIEWEQDLNQRPEYVKRSIEGKYDTVAMQQGIENMKPFFKLLKTKQMPDDVMLNLARISQYMQEREYVKANDTYYLLSIGNSAWPIGVTMVGIHERSAREKIFSNQVAHVLNDEKTRKWIQSMKRLMTFCQKKYLPDDLSKTAGWVKN